MVRRELREMFNFSTEGGSEELEIYCSAFRDRESTRIELNNRFLQNVNNYNCLNPSQVLEENEIYYSVASQALFICSRHFKNFETGLNTAK